MEISCHRNGTMNYKFVRINYWRHLHLPRYLREARYLPNSLLKGIVLRHRARPAITALIINLFLHLSSVSCEDFRDSQELRQGRRWIIRHFQ